MAPLPGLDGDETGTRRGRDGDETGTGDRHEDGSASRGGGRLWLVEESTTDTPPPAFLFSSRMGPGGSAP